MDGSKLLTIAVPSYNVQNTLPATLDSLCAAEKRELLDILVVDDGSADETARVAGEYTERFPGVVRLITQKNGGHGAAVNTGIKNALGRYFKVVDGDDTLSKQGFDRLLDTLESTECDLIATHYKKVPQNGEAPVPMRFEGVEYNRVYRFEELPVDGRLYFGIHSSTFRTALLRENEVRLQEHTFYVDTELCLLPVPFLRTVCFLDEYVYLYTVGTAGQSINFDNFVRRYDDHNRVVRRLVAYYAGPGIGGARGEYMLTALSKLCFTNYMLGAFYDSDHKRGRRRAREFDAWLYKQSPQLYERLGKSMYIRVMRVLRFSILPGPAIKRFAAFSYARLKPAFRKRRRFTY